MDNEVVEDGLAGVGATVMGRRMFSGGQGPWEDDPNADAWWGDGDVAVSGGADVVQQYLAAGLLEEIQLHVVPVLLGEGVRLFGGALPNAPRALERTRVIESPTGVTHVKYQAAS